MDNWWVVVLSVIVPLIGFMLALRPWIKDTVRVEIGDVRERLARIDGRLDEIGKQTRGIADLMPPAPSNPDSTRQELLGKWKQGTLTYEESVQLRDILAHEAEQADETKKVLIALGLIGLLLYGLSRME